MSNIWASRGKGSCRDDGGVFVPGFSIFCFPSLRSLRSGFLIKPGKMSSRFGVADFVSRHYYSQ